MAQPRLQLRRGTQSPVEANVTTALAGEPFFDTSNDNLWVADGSSTFVHIGGASYTSRVDAFLTNETSTVGGKVVLKEGTSNGTDTVTIKSPDTLAASYTLTLPGDDGSENQVLKTDGSGTLSWATMAVNSFTSIAVGGSAATSGSSNIEADQSGDTLTFAEGEGIDIFTNATTDTITISAELASDTNKGVASFSTDNFLVTDGVVTIKDDGVALGTETTGNYVEDVTAGAGLTKSSSATEGQTVDLAVGAGTGITVNADDVALKNAGNLSDGTVLGWNSTNTQLENSPVTYSGNDVSVAGDLTVTGNDIKSSGGTTAITLDGANVTIQGNLTVSGTSTVLNTETLKVEDRIIELGLVAGSAPSAGTTWDMAVAFNYHATTAKKSAIVWMDNAGFELASVITETSDTGNADPQIAVGTHASLGVASLYIGGIATAANEVINSSKEVINVTIDCGTY